MAKDPAFLFYPGDFKMGTLVFSREEKGDYIDLICALHSNGGYMSLEDIKIVCPFISDKVMSKLKKDESKGIYYQQRLLTEILKRKSFSESRRKNRLGNTSVVKSDVTHDNISVEHMSSHMENENRNEIEVFEEYRQMYLGTKRGLETEFLHFQKHLDWKACLPLLKPAVKAQILARAAKKQKGEFVPEWKNMKTWIYQRCWEEEVKQVAVPGKTGRQEHNLVKYIKQVWMLPFDVKEHEIDEVYLLLPIEARTKDKRESILNYYKPKKNEGSR